MALPAIPEKGRMIRRYPVKAAETWPEGGILLLDANGELIEAGADPAVILGFAAHAMPLAELDPDPGYALVYVAGPDSTFWVEGTTGPAAVDVGDLYEIGVDAAGVGRLDKTAQVANRLKINNVDLTRALYEVNILAANRQLQI